MRRFSFIAALLLSFVFAVTNAEANIVTLEREHYGVFTFEKTFNTNNGVAVCQIMTSWGNHDIFGWAISSLDLITIFYESDTRTFNQNLEHRIDFNFSNGDRKNGFFTTSDGNFLILQEHILNAPDALIGWINSLAEARSLAISINGVHDVNLSLRGTFRLTEKLLTCYERL